MNRFTKIASLTVILGLIGGVWLPTPASAQVIYSYYPPAPVVTYSAPVTVVQPAPVQFVQPAVSYYQAPPSVSYYTPVAPVQSTVTYYPPAPAPVTYSYYPPPATVVYASPSPVYTPATTVVTPGYVTTRSYLGLGIFRPFGINRETYVSPGSRTTYYTPVYP